MMRTTLIVIMVHRNNNLRKDAARLSARAVIAFDLLQPNIDHFADAASHGRVQLRVAEVAGAEGRGRIQLGGPAARREENCVKGRYRAATSSSCWATGTACAARRPRGADDAAVERAGSRRGRRAA